MASRERFHGRRDDGAGRSCDHPGCTEVGEFRAPRPPGKSGGEGFYLFCLDHVRLYNEQWDYFKGMSKSQVEQAAYAAYTWERPTFPRYAGNRPFPDLDDALNLFGDGPGPGQSFAQGWDRKRRTPEDVRALTVLGLEADADQADIKESYRRLVRAYHPDTNGGGREMEKKLMAVIEAYKHLHAKDAKL